jgi:hypothetical protein
MRMSLKSCVTPLSNYSRVSTVNNRHNIRGGRLNPRLFYDQEVFIMTKGGGMGARVYNLFYLTQCLSVAFFVLYSWMYEVHSQVRSNFFFKIHS